ncbi:MAG: pitrilysin family protein [Bacteroidales bacterium]|nr:pitrilysin family protein [Bacteroidales bacterium]MDP2236685.1 pitrilysin family protein [Bacteroidales bacterium]
MIKFDTFTLINGLRFVVHHDANTPIVAMNILYDVGARDEHPEKTGFAHLFEHLMFGGSINIPRYDEPLQRAGGDNNAFTNSDITNYYLTLPKENIETAFWLESDRMLSLSFSEKSFEVQRQVVVEEFRQNYLNQPYGDAWLLLKPLAYTTHPYQWNTIGKEISHIEQATLQDVKDFYARYYNPNNAVIAIAGDITTEEVKQLAEKWFASIPSGPEINRALPSEPQQQEARKLQVEKKVPVDVIYKAWHMCGRNDDDYYATDLISDLLGSGQSSRLVKELIKKQELFAEISAFITGDFDPGLFVITGKLLPGISFEAAEEGINKQIAVLKQKSPSMDELRKVKNRVVSGQAFSSISVLSKAMNLAFYTHLGDTELINSLTKQYRNVLPTDIKRVANNIFAENNCSTLYYTKEND